jgi:hypothetical protein
MNEYAGNTSVKKYKIAIGILSAIIVALAIMLIITRTQVRTFVIEKELQVAQTEALQTELDSLLVEHEKMKADYGDLSKDLIRKDSIIQANADEIQKLIASNAGKHQIQKKLDYLRGITQDYVAQIDKLLQENQNLKTEIAGITDNYNKEKDYSASLVKDKEQLSDQINKAAVLSATNVSVQGVRKRTEGYEVVDRAKKTEKIRITFTIAKNPLVKAGMKEVYVRIARPDNAILNDGQSFDFNGQAIMYSLKHTFNYQDKPIPVTLFYEKTDRIVVGSYHVALFIDGQEVGQGQCTLN